LQLLDIEKDLPEGDHKGLTRNFDLVLTKNPRWHLPKPPGIKVVIIKDDTTILAINGKTNN